MKIGILSLKYQTNYGGILQSFALQQVIEELGHEAEIINYSSTIRESWIHRIFFRIFNLLFTKNIFTTIRDKKKENKKITAKDPQELINNNESFMQKYLRRGVLVNENTIEENCKKYDCIIVGSDQIWSVTDASKLIYFFDWKFSGKKISYAACSVNRKPAFLNRLKIERLLNQFDSLSVRDVVTENFVFRTAGIHPPIVVDPTFMYNYDSLLGERIIKEPYVLIYILGDEITGGNKKALDIIKKKCPNGTKVVSIVIPSVSMAGIANADIVFNDADPLTWINLIKYADYVFTDSFHGVVFSLKYKKEFIAYYTFAKRATRLIDLDKRYKIGKIVTTTKEIEELLSQKKTPDYESIETHIIESKKYISKIL